MSPSSANADGVTLRPMTTDDLPSAHALSDELRWPHRLADWELALRHGDGHVAVRDDEVVGTALRWRWGPRHATIGLVIVKPSCQGRRIGRSLMDAALDGLEGASLLLHATPDGLGLYERLGFRQVGQVRQHQGMPPPAPLVALDNGWRMRPASTRDLPALSALDGQARGMPRDALIAELLSSAEASVVLDHDDEPRGFALLRRFGRGHVIGPVVAPDTAGAQALIAHLAGQNAGRFTRIDIDAATGLANFVEDLGLKRVDAPTTMVRGPAEPQAAAAGRPLLVALVTQALG
jgi:predicted N-acetyltransferase YhbS